MSRRPTFTECAKLAEHYLAVGQNEIYLDEEHDDLPWDHAVSVVAGGSYRLNGLSSARVIAKHDSGLTFTWHFDFEGSDANGTGVNQFDAQKMLGIASKMPPKVREQFASLLNLEVWPSVRKRTDEIREALRKQEDSLGVLQSIAVAVGKVTA
ncbi:hypothetical protein ACC782_33830 [Rhizobium ruizarguesonis]